MQQRPIPLSGSIIKQAWLRYYVPGEQPAVFDRRVQSWDTANKADQLNDYSVCTTWGVKDNLYYLLHVLRTRMEYPALHRTIVQHAADHAAQEIIIEDKASGTQLIQSLGHGVPSFYLRAYEPPSGMDKIMRMRAQSLAFENGRVLLPTEASWLSDYVIELIGFPGTKYDDQVDSTSQALACLTEPTTADKLMKAYGPGGPADEWLNQLMRGQSGF